MPQVGFGVFQLPDADAQGLTEFALSAGYRHIDTAAAYGNERAIGRAIAASQLDRDELFVTTKVWNADHGYDATLEAFERSRDALGIDIVDLYLIHFPAPRRRLWQQTWRALEQLYDDASVRAIGVSNFVSPYLGELLDIASVVPAVHQIEVHPTYQQRHLDAAGRGAGVMTEAYSPLGRGADLGHPDVVAIAERHGVSASQVILCWHLCAGRVVIPKSATPARITQNLELSGIHLSDDEIATIDSLERGLRTGEDVETFD